jgi:site-specific DNA-methyltransferase (adenine-specific)/modification methylase
MPRVLGNYGEREDHPSQKPVALMVRVASSAPDAKTALDPFMGSGTTGVACAQLGKAFTGIERERKYFDIACQRIYNAQCQSKLFGADEDVQKVQPEQAVFGFPAK